MSRRRFAAGLAGAAAVAGLGGIARGGGSKADSSADVTASPVRPHRPARGWQAERYGTSVQGRDLWVDTFRPSHPTKRLLVVAAVHGNERGTVPFARQVVEQVTPPDHVQLDVVICANPDGWDVQSRQNANFVDLNRNFPEQYGWTEDDEQGPHAASEPETQALMALADDIQPDLAVYVHQPLNYVASVGDTPGSWVQKWVTAANASPLFGVSQSGGAETWTNAAIGCPTLLIEIATMRAQPAALAAHRRGFDALLAAV